jgi:hypothetical protein
MPNRRVFCRVMAAQDASEAPFLFCSPIGIQLCRDIVQNTLGYDPHDYSFKVAAKILDGVDCLVRTGCGSGKSGIIALLAILFIRLGEDPSKIPANCRRVFPRSPAILVVCPTNALEINLVCLARKIVPTLYLHVTIGRKIG